MIEIVIVYTIGLVIGSIITYIQVNKQWKETNEDVSQPLDTKALQEREKRLRLIGEYTIAAALVRGNGNYAEANMINGILEALEECEIDD